MILKDLMEANDISQYRLSKMTGVGQATISDLVNGKVTLDKAMIGTVYKLSKALGLTVDELMELHEKEKAGENYVEPFEQFKENTRRQLKEKGDLDFLKATIGSNIIRILYEKKQMKESLYLLAMVDYLCRVNGIAHFSEYADLRNKTLPQPLYPRETILLTVTTKNEIYKVEAIRNAIPEFRDHNIIECNIRDVKE